MGKALMIQGTASHVGKSLLVTALCRIFRQDGLRVAPFKAQNMSLNSYVTPDGKEISRAQAVQAEAAGVPAEAVMNPILLKPTADRRAQVVVLGRPLAHTDAREYRERQVPLLARVVEESLRQLLARFEVVVIEGAGSPAEVNLRERDLANMRVAAFADAPVLLVGDIDRGGMLASVVGTLALLPEEERGRIAGVVVNKFRGDPELLRPGLEFLTRRTGLPVIGVIPYFPTPLLDEEDSVALESRNTKPADPGSPLVAVLRLPHLANFTDLGPLEQEPGLSLRYVPPGRPVGRADAVIIPGSKSTLADLRYLKQQGYHRELPFLLRQGALVMGICGGYQMLGHLLADPLGVEGPPGEEEGLGLLDTCTVFLPEKETHLVEAEVTSAIGFLAYLRSRLVRGYETHMGITLRLGAASPWLRLRRRGERPTDLPEGAVDPTGRVWGTYLHDIFLNPDFRRAFLTWLRRQKGLPTEPGSKEETQVSLPFGDPYDQLARLVRAHLDLDFVYRLLKI